MNDDGRSDRVGIGSDEAVHIFTSGRERTFSQKVVSSTALQQSVVTEYPPMLADFDGNWTQRHRRWLARQTFQEEAHGIVFQDYLETVWTAQERRDALIKRISSMVASWSLGPLVEALRGLRGIDLISAATFIASTGDLSRFESPRLLMGYLGLVPSEHSSGGTIRRGGITKTGNREARRMLIEAAWSYQYPARIAKEKAEILVRLPKSIRDIAWKATDQALHPATVP